MSELSSVITELKVIAQDELGEHKMGVREVCADAVEHLIYLDHLIARIAQAEKELHDQLDARMGIVR